MANDDNDPRPKPAIDEVEESHAQAGESLPPLGPNTGLSLSAQARLSQGQPQNKFQDNSQINSTIPPTVSSGSSPDPSGFPAQSNGSGSTSASFGSNGFGNNTQSFNNGASSNFGSYNTGSYNGFGNNTGSPNSGVNQTTEPAARYFGDVMANAEGRPPEHWIKSFWRPVMGWLYMLINLMDFVIFPMLAMFLPIIMRAFDIDLKYTPWQSLTLSNGGLIHLAFGAILGVSAWSRGQEKMMKKH